MLLSRIFKVFIYLMIAASIFWYFIYFIFPDQESFIGIRYPEKILFFGSASFFFAVLGGSMWLFKKAIIKDRRLLNKVISRGTYRFIYKHHVLIGITVLITAVSHVAYFLVKGSDRPYMTATGWAAMNVLVLLFIFGLWLRKSSHNYARVLHMSSSEGIFTL